MKVEGASPAAQITIRTDCAESERLRNQLDSLPNPDTTTLQPIDPPTDNSLAHPDPGCAGAPRLTLISEEESENGSVDAVERESNWFVCWIAQDAFPRASSSDRACP
jgi:hypothetical protein